jgi:hypothetical protein
VAYRLELPPSSSIHTVFHVSQLKLSLGDQQVSYALPSHSVTGLRETTPKSRVSSSGRILHLIWLPGSHSSHFVSNSHVRWPRDMPALKTQGM